MNKQTYRGLSLVLDHIRLIQTSNKLSQEEQDNLVKRMNETMKEFKVKLMVNGKEWDSIKENGE